MSDPLNLKKHIREVKDFPIAGINFRDITSLIENPEAFQTTCKELIEVSKNFNASVIASIESRGFIFAGSISFELGLPFVLARKPGKLPNKTFKKDFEGLALYQSDMENGVIVISVQGSNGYALLDRKTQTLIRFIKVVDGNGIDGTSDTDGLEVSTISTNRFKKGFLVVQDGFNDDGFQNFKLIDWLKID